MEVQQIIKNKLPHGSTTDFVRKIAHQKNMNVDFMENICKYVMIKDKNWNTQMQVTIALVVKRILPSYFFKNAEDSSFTQIFV